MKSKTEIIKKLIYESKHLVVLEGNGLTQENNYPSFLDDDWSYRIEEDYGYSPEELLSSTYFSTRKDRFFKFYQEEIICEREKPNAAYQALAELERQGILKAVITRQIYGLCREAGCQNVYEFRGNIHRNFCSKCRRSFTMEYMRENKIPTCPDCNIPIHPDIRMFGEMMENSIVSKAIEQVATADVLIALGIDMNSSFLNKLYPYYKGDKLVLIKSENHFMDYQANYTAYGKISELLPKMIK